MSMGTKGWMICLALSVLLGPVRVDAEDNDAGYPGGILRHSGTVFRTGFAEGGVALSGDAGGLYHNPAAILRASRTAAADLMLVPGGFEGSTYAASLSRQGLGRTGFLADCAVGMTIVRYDVGDILPRGPENTYQPGVLDYDDQVVMLGFAHEWTSSQGVLGWGFGAKWLSQGLAGDAYDLGSTGFGVDFGLQFQPIHLALVEKKFGLKTLLPLRLGFNVQNLVRPAVGLGDVEEDVPRVYRLGLAYDFIDLLGPGSVLTFVFDRDWMDAGDLEGRGGGTYPGLQVKLDLEGLDPAIRLGHSWVGSHAGFAAGFSLSPEIMGHDVRFHYAVAGSDLGPEHRFGLGFAFGNARDIAFRTAAVQEHDSLSVYLRALADYPAEGIETVAKTLGKDLDPRRKSRYFKLVGGVAAAREYYADMIARFLSGDVADGRKDAANAGEEYARAVDEGETMDAKDVVRYAEALLSRAEVRAADADTAAALMSALISRGEAPDLLQARYQLAVAHLVLGDAPAAYDEFGRALQAQDNGRGMKLFARLGRADAARDLATARSLYRDLLDEGDLALRPGFPRFHPGVLADGRPLAIRDTILADDVLLILHDRLAGEGRAEESEDVLSELYRFYPDSESAARARARSDDE